MKNMKFWRTALVATLVLTVMLSVTGGTIAWFTDTVTSEVNTISAGNLDMKVSFKPYGAENTEWTEVKADTKIFKANALYEPGYTEVYWLKIENAGSLAFKYKSELKVLSETPGVNQAGESFNLSDSLVIKTGYISNDFSGYEALYTEREVLLNNTFAFVDKKLSSTDLMLASESVLYPAENDWDTSYQLLILHMPTTVGNEANHNGTDIPEIELGLSVVATQVPHESDAFGSGYDAGATYLEVDMDNAPKANVTMLKETDEKYPDVINYQWSPVDGAEYQPQILDVVYDFMATETKEEAMAGEYGEWHADFVVYADKDIPAKSIALAGQYSDWPWLGFANPETVTAGTEIRLLKDAAGLAVSYKEVCDFQHFYCGTAETVEGALEGVTLTVELRLYEAPSGALETETTKYKIIGTFTHTF